ncbi:MAG: MFS transporter [Burkholderiales bacterium RIFCSPLOWO2_02_FULL_57_36]|nr:MAG: MFS transporter [Burkholderiales bacterium RIFCSPLOWO2_02_FULL_57_36]
MEMFKRPPAWIMIVTGMLVTLVVVVLARLAYGLILPFMRENLGLSYQQAGNLGTASALGYLCLVMLAGAYAARRGGRAAVLLGLALTTAGFIGLSFASHYWWLIVFMALLGFGTAFGYTPVISLLASWFPERRGAVIGMANSGVGVGILGTGTLVPYLSASYGADGWRITWAVFVAISALALAAAFLFLRNPPNLVNPGNETPTPIDKTSVYRNRHVITVGLLYGIIGITYIAQAIFMYSFALDSGVPALTAGRLAALMGILSIFSSPAWGWLSDRFGRGSSLVASVALTLVGTLIPVVWPTLPSFAAHFIIVGCTISGMFTSVLAASAEHVKPAQAPLAMSYVTLFYAIGQFIGPAAAGLMIEQAGGFRAAFAASCVVMGFGVYLSWKLRTFRQ